MVSDKSQARSTGPVMAITRQPVKGRKKHGGIRLGEMERDALLSHGVAFCLHDRYVRTSLTLILLLSLSLSLLLLPWSTISISLNQFSSIHRLMNCSDNHLAYVCSNCGGLLSVYSQMPEESVKGTYLHTCVRVYLTSS